MKNKEIAKKYCMSGKPGYTPDDLEYVKNGYDRIAKYSRALEQMRFESFSEEDMLFFKEQYLTTKDIGSRRQILQAFVLQCLQYDLKDFFLAAFKKERYLDMRLMAIRGYAAYATEKEIIPLIKKFMEILVKIPSHTPYNYEEYEMLRSKFGLPYLIEKYGYDCFKEVFAQLEKQYNAMPKKYKGIFTLDENGMTI